MKKDLTDITMIIDRSGSMCSCQDEATNGINTFIKDQKKQKGQCIFSLVQFDTEYEFVYKGENIKRVKKYVLYPRGMTALLDAVGRAINETGERLAAIKEEERPSLVIVAIVTDGQENASHEFTKNQIKDMISHQQEKYNWQFTFLGANQDAFLEGMSLGINKDGIANYNIHNTVCAYSSLSNNVSRMRGDTFAGRNVSNAYTEEELNSMEK